MNADYDPPSEPAEDPLVDEAIAYLKRLEPPLETRIKNRVVVADELKTLLRASQPRAWWRRSISVPVPIAAGLAAIVALALSLNFRASRERLPIVAAHPDQRANDPSDGEPEKTKIVPRAHGLQPVREYYAHETYLCGLGQLRFESSNFSKEQSQ
jgi:hypothetical protein